MNINTDFLDRCIETLETAFTQLSQYEPGDITYDIYRAACVKEFEIVLEQSGNLLKKRLRPYFASNRQADRLTFKDVFRHAAKHGLISVESCGRWLEYRDNCLQCGSSAAVPAPHQVWGDSLRNDTAHDYGEGFAETTLKLLPGFIADARELTAVIGAEFDE